MKKLLLLFSISLFAFNTKAQELNFEETVKYIQTKLDDVGEHGRYTGSGKFAAKPNGEIKCDNVSNFRFNFFDLDNSKNDKYTDEFGITVNHPAIDPNVLAPFIVFTSNGRGIGALYFENSTSVNDLERVHKALVHLRSLCTKEKDPFDK